MKECKTFYLNQWRISATCKDFYNLDYKNSWPKWHSFLKCQINCPVQRQIYWIENGVSRQLFAYSCPNVCTKSTKFSNKREADKLNPSLRQIVPGKRSGNPRISLKHIPLSVNKTYLIKCVLRPDSNIVLILLLHWHWIGRISPETVELCFMCTMEIMPRRSQSRSEQNCSIVVYFTVITLFLFNGTIVMILLKFLS